jgi:hypothetical protein
MRVLDSIRELSRSLASTIADRIEAQRRLSRFACGDCELHDHCGLPPSDTCDVRMAHIELYGDRRRPRPPLRTAIW